MYWIIPLLLAFLCTLINPYIGLVGILYIGEIVVYWFFDENAEKAADFASGYVEKTDAKYYEVLKKAGKGCLNFWCGLAVLFFVLMTMISVIVETVASGTMLGGPTTLTPFLIGSKENRAAYGVALLMISILLYCGTGYDIFAKKIFLRKTKRYQTIKDTCFKRRKSGKQIRKYTDWDWWDSGCTDIGSRSVRHDE